MQFPRLIIRQRAGNRQLWMESVKTCGITTKKKREFFWICISRNQAEPNGMAGELFMCVAKPSNEYAPTRGASYRLDRIGH